MKTLLHQAHERGHADHGWLNAHHSFSFSSWYDPSKVHFGMLRVLNDDTVAGGQGFGMHPHDNMEIITIIRRGALQHRDSMGNGSVIRPGDVQVMSAGTGVFHSEFNPLPDQATELFQLWIFPKEKNIAPRYDQKTFEPGTGPVEIQTVASGFRQGEELYIHQNAAVSLARLSAGNTWHYPIAREGNGAYIMVVEGRASIAGNDAGKRDAVGVWATADVTIIANHDTELLIIDVPMH